LQNLSDQRFFAAGFVPLATQAKVFKGIVMATQTQGTVVGVFSDHDRARQAIKALKDQGFTESQIGVASAHSEGLRRVSGDDAGDESYAAEGATAGVAAGAGLGALWGLGILAGALPAIGPAIAGGTLAAILSSAAAGAAAAGLGGALLGMGVSKDEAEYYESELKSGRTVVTVSAGSRRSEAQSILQRFGAYDMATRGSATSAATMSSSAQCATTCDTSSTSSLASGVSSARPVAGNTVQAREEQLHVDKTRAKTGEVHVRKETHVEHKTIDVPVTREEVVIERRPVGGKATTGDAGREEIRIPVSEEQVNVEKQTVVKEEVSVGKRKVQDTKRVDADLKKEEIKVDTKGSANVRNKSK
jgi:uncharacterized protein (TIGR02271 family)